MFFETGIFCCVCGFEGGVLVEGAIDVVASFGGINDPWLECFYAVGPAHEVFCLGVYEL